MIYPVFFTPDEDEPSGDLVYSGIKSFDSEQHDVFLPSIICMAFFANTEKMEAQNKFRLYNNAIGIKN